jgi:hypothetical protein
MACIEQLMAEVEAITVGEADDGVLTSASKLLAEHKEILARVKRI